MLLYLLLSKLAYFANLYRDSFTFSNTYYIGSLPTATDPYGCIYLPHTVIKEGSVKVNRICHNFKMKHFNVNSQIEIVDNCILCPQ